MSSASCTRSGTISARTSGSALLGKGGGAGARASCGAQPCFSISCFSISEESDIMVMACGGISWVSWRAAAGASGRGTRRPAGSPTGSSCSCWSSSMRFRPSSFCSCPDAREPGVVDRSPVGSLPPWPGRGAPCPTAHAVVSAETQRSVSSAEAQRSSILLPGVLSRKPCCSFTGFDPKTFDASEILEFVLTTGASSSAAWARVSTPRMSRKATG
mmetsp:Transcript_14297/g.42650  ORF Transcript_14297/g.42650 Transcript_14297/m.42650 type:complete len:215 (-) Transcript_14297:275-919(-)